MYRTYSMYKKLPHMFSMPMEGPRMGKHEFYFYVECGVADMFDRVKNNLSKIKTSIFKYNLQWPPHGVLVWKY